VRITIHRVGRSRERWWQEAEQDYLRRLGPPWQIELREIRAVEVNDVSQVAEARQLEAQRILQALAPRSHVIALDERGAELTSPQWAAAMGELLDGGAGEVEFIIGGAFGLDETVRKRADAVWACGYRWATRRAASH